MEVKMEVLHDVHEIDSIIEDKLQVPNLGIDFVTKFSLRMEAYVADCGCHAHVTNGEVTSRHKCEFHREAEGRDFSLNV